MRQFRACGVVGFFIATLLGGLAPRSGAAEGDMQSIEALIAALDDADPTKRFAAAEGLGKLGPMASSSASALIARLDDRAMRKSGAPPTIEDEVWVAASKALGALGADAVPDLVRALESENKQVVRGAALSLRVIGPPAKDAVAPLMKLLERDDDETRHQAILALAGIGPGASDAVGLLTKMLDHADFHTQYQSIRALALIGEAAKPAVPEIVRQLSSRITSVRRNAAEALGQMQAYAGDDVAAVAGLIKTLNDPIEPVREAAAISLGKFGPKAMAAADPLREMVKRKRLATPTAALLAIWKITGESAEAISMLLAQIDNPDAPWAAAAALAEIKPATPEIIDGLTARLTSPDAEARLACAQALGTIGPDAKSAQESLKKLLQDEDESIRAAAQEALDKIAPK